MVDSFLNFLVGRSFIPHGHCYLWKPELVGLHVISDGLIAIAYYSIPLTLLHFVRNRRDLPFNWMFLLFGTFIVACGTTHILEIWTLWHPMYWLSGIVKAATAAVSLFTALELIPLMPKALSLPSPAQLEAANRELEREIAERKQSEARYRAIVEDQAELVVRFQADETITFVNESYCRYFQKPREAIVGQRFQPDIFGEDYKEVQRLIHSLNQENPVATLENRVVTGGTVRWMQWNSRMLFDEHNQFVEFQSVGRDITDLKRAEDALRQSQRFIQKIADTSPVILYVYDLSKECNVYVNHDITHLLGYEPEEVRPHTSSFPDPILHPDDAAQMPENFKRWQTVQDGDILCTELRMRHRTGEWRYFQCQETLFARHADGSPQQILGVAVDITAAKRLEEVRKAEERLQASLKEKEVLLKEIHHRVKNNLQIVYSLLRLQYRRIKDRLAADILLESQNRIKSIALIHEKLYRSEDLAKIDLSHYIPNLVTSLFSSYSINTNTITLKTRVDDVSLDIDTAIPCGLIINELVSNSLKYAFPANRAGTIAVELHATGDRTVMLTVRDDGIGIPDKFELARAGSLGLKLVNDLVKQLEGTIVLNCQHGTEFKISFVGNEA